MKNFPSQALILTMEPEDLGPHMLKYMMRGQAETNRFNFMQMVYPGQIAERFMGDARLVRWSILDLPEPVGASRGQVR